MMRLLPCVCLLLSLLSLSPALDTIEPIPWPGDALAWVAVPSLNRALDQLQGMVAVFDPDSAESLRSDMRRDLGDEIVDAIDLDRTASAILLPGNGMPPTPGYAVIIPVRDAAPLLVMLEATGAVHRLQDDLLLVVSENAVLEQADALIAAHRALPSTIDAEDMAQIEIAMGRIMQTYGMMAQGGLGMLPMILGGNLPPDQQNLIPIMQLAGHAYLTMMMDIDQVSLSVRLGPTPRVYKRVAAKADSALAGAFQAPQDPAGWHQAWSRLPEGERIMAVGASMDMDGLRALMDHIIGQLQQQPGLTSMINADLVAGIEQLFAHQGDHSAAIIRGGDDFFQQDSINQCRDPEAWFAAMESLLPLMNELLASIDANMAMRLERGVRQSAGVTVHRLHTVADATALDPQLAMMGMENARAPRELAGHQGWLLGSPSPERLDQMIAGTVEAPALPAAVETFGADANAYCDYHLATQMQRMFAGFLGQPVQRPSDDQPVTMAIRTADGILHAGILVPLEPFRALNEGAMAPPLEAESDDIELP